MNVTVRQEGWWRAPRRGNRPGSWHYYRPSKVTIPKPRVAWRSLCDRSALDKPGELKPYRDDLVVTCEACLRALVRSSS